VILVRHERDVALVLLNRPDRRNALTPGMFDALRESLSEIKASGAAALLLGGEGPSFCGGFDLKLCAQRQGTLEALLRGLFETISLLRSLPVPVVVAAHGGAIAGGCALLGGADVVVTDRSARLGYPVLPLGISPAVSAPFLRLAIGDGACRARLLDPELISGTEAARLGLAHELVDSPDEVRSRAMELAQSLASMPRFVMPVTREWLSQAEDSSSAVPARQGLERSLSLVGSDEERERLAARLGG
jgi:2-(1,2-epoxy-1,2-dihydrophenyl)acetyl-CoA isomerase